MTIRSGAEAFTGSVQDRHSGCLAGREMVFPMTAYEVTQDLLEATTGSNSAAHPPAQRRKSLRRLRAVLTGGVAAGALLIAAPAASAATVPAGPPHSAVAPAPTESTLPSTIVLTTRRTGSVVL